MPDSTSGVRRFEGGGTITINDGASAGGATTTTVLRIKEGTLKWTRGGYKHLLLMDRDTIIDSYEGPQQPCAISLDINYTGAQASTDIYTVLAARDTTTGKMKYYTIAIKIPTVKGGAAGESITFNKVIVPEGALNYESGTEFDTLKCGLLDLAPQPTLATY